MCELSVVLPCYQAGTFVAERVAHLEAYLDNWRDIEYEIVLVDDGSDDDTPTIIKSLAERKRIRAVLRAANGGKFAALRDGVAVTKGSVVTFTDADVPYDLAFMKVAHTLLGSGGFHLVIGDRHLPASQYFETLPIVRKMSTWAFSSVIRLLTIAGVEDTQCGFKAFRGDVARAIFPLVQDNGFAGDVEVLYISLKYNLAVRRIPVQLNYHGASSVKPLRDGPRMLKALGAMPIRYRLGKYDSDALARISKESYHA